MTATLSRVESIVMRRTTNVGYYILANFKSDVWRLCTFPIKLVQLKCFNLDFLEMVLSEFIEMANCTIPTISMRIDGARYCFNYIEGIPVYFRIFLKEYF